MGARRGCSRKTVRPFLGAGRRRLFGVSVEQEGQRGAVGARGRLDHVGMVVRVLLRIEVRQLLAAVLFVLLEVVVGAVRDAFQFAPAPRVLVLDVRAGLGVMRQFRALMRAQAQLLAADAQARRTSSAAPSHQYLNQYMSSLPSSAKPRRRDEVLHLHLLELARAEREVLDRDLVAEALALLRDAEGRLEPHAGLHVQEVDEHRLRGLGPQVHRGLVRWLRRWRLSAVPRRVRSLPSRRAAMFSTGSTLPSDERNIRLKRRMSERLGLPQLAQTSPSLPTTPLRVSFLPL